MSPARRLALGFARTFFRLALISSITLFTVIVTFGTADILKQSLRDTNAYTSVVPSILESNAKQDPKGIFADKPVRDTFEAAFTPPFVERSATMFLDATYRWLNGQTSQPDFVIDITEQRQKLAEELSIYGLERLASLPQCTAFEAELVLDPFKATCQPAGVNYRSEQLALQQSLLTSPDFLPKTIYTADDLPKSQTGKTLPETLSKAPLAFQLFKPALAVLLLLIVLLAIIMVSLRPVRRSGFRELGRALFFSGAFLAVSAVVFGIVIPRVSRSFQSQFVTGGTEKLMGDLIQSLTVQFETIFIYASLAAAGLGIVILGFVRFTKQGERYKKLEHVTGLANAISPKADTIRDRRATAAPIVSSERSSTRRHRSEMGQQEKRVKKEIV